MCLFFRFADRKLQSQLISQCMIFALLAFGMTEYIFSNTPVGQLSCEYFLPSHFSRFVTSNGVLLLEKIFFFCFQRLDASNHLCFYKFILTHGSVFCIALYSLASVRLLFCSAAVETSMSAECQTFIFFMCLK